MDLHDVDQTQAIFRDESEEDDGTDELLPDAERQPKSFLKVLFQKGMTEKSYPVYEGENIIGRNAGTCHICIPSKALSKEHACIEIIKDLHVIYDKGSRNKTKWKKTFLSPDVRFELNSNDEISFADIKCVYIKSDPDMAMSHEEGSETDGSESFLLQMEISKDKDVSNLSTSKTSLFAHMDDSNVESGVAGNNDCDSPLPPTQTFAVEKASKPALSIQETPEKTCTEHPSTVVLTESESEDEDIGRQKELHNATGRSSTGSAVLCADSGPDSSLDSDKFCMATQAYFSDSNKDKKEADHSNEPTQVCHIDEQTQACHSDEPTRAFLQKKDDNQHSVTASANSSCGQSTDSGGNKSTDGTQSFDVNSNLKPEKKSDQDDAVLTSTQVFEEEEDADNEDAVRLFAMSTMAPEEELDDEDEDNQGDDKAECDTDAKSITDSEGETMPVESNATVAVSTIDEKVAVGSRVTDYAEPTQAYGRDDNEMETQQYGDGDGEADKKHVVKGRACPDEPTQVYRSTSEEDATQAFNECGDHERTDDQGATETIAITEPTQVITEDEPTQVIGLDGPTQMVSTDEATQEISADEPTQMISADEPTQMVSSDEPTQKIAVDQPTQMISADEPTQKFDFPDDENIPVAHSVTRKEEESHISDDSDLESSALKTDNILENEATQVFDMEPLHPETINSNVQPTLAYRMEVEENDLSANQNEDSKRRKGDVNAKGQSCRKIQGTVPKDSPKKKAEATTSGDSECYSYPMSPVLEDIVDTLEMTPESPPRPKSPPNPPSTRSPLKSALVDRKRTPSPSPPPKRVAFKESTIKSQQKEIDIGLKQRRSRRTGTEAVGKQSGASDSLPNRLGKSSTFKSGESPKTKNAKELDNKETTDDVAEGKKESVPEKSSARGPEFTSRRGRRKKGGTSKEDEQNEKVDTDSVSSVATSEKGESDLAGRKAMTSSSQEKATGKRLKGKALQRQKASGSSKAVNSLEADEDNGGQSVNTNNGDNRLKPADSTEDQNIETDGKDRGNKEKDEDSEVDNSTSRRGRRITRNKLYDDFDTGGTKKRESISKPIKTRARKSSSAIDLDKRSEKSVTESQNDKNIDNVSVTDDLNSSTALTNNRKRKSAVEKNVVIVSETTGEPRESASSSKRASRGKKSKRSESPKDESSKSTTSATTSVFDQTETPSRARSRLSINTDTQKCEKEESKNSGKVKMEDKTQQKKGAGKRVSMANGQEEDGAKGGTKRAKSSVGDATEQTSASEMLSPVKPGKGGKKAQGRKAQKSSEVSVTRGKRGASSATVVSDKEDTPSTNVKQSPQESTTKGKRKKTTPRDEEEICTPPAKRGKSSVESGHILRQSTMENKPKVMFTGIIDEEGEKTVKDLGGELVTNIQECSHLVTDKIRRTVKFLGCLCKGVLIVSQQWLDSSRRAGTFLNGQNFLVKGKDMEKQYKFSLGSSIATAKRQSLFDGFHIHVSKSVKPDPNQMRDILQCSGAEVLPKMPSKLVEKTVVISCPSDEKLCKPAINAGIPVVTAEFILTGILQQKVDISAYRLFHVDSS